jgi:nitroreductase
MFFIAGITGHVGGAAARHLLAKDEQVRTLLRTPEKAKEFADQGVEIQQGDLNDADALAQALQGVEGAFLLMQPAMSPPPDFSDARASLASYTAALAKAPVPRLVALSSKALGNGKLLNARSIRDVAMIFPSFSVFSEPIESSALVFLVSKSTMRSPRSGNEVPSPTHSFDARTASGYFALQASLMGWYVHGMVGFDADRAFEDLSVPKGHKVEAVYAVGRKADPAGLPEELRARDLPSDRRSLEELAFEGGFPQ